MHIPLLLQGYICTSNFTNNFHNFVFFIHSLYFIKFHTGCIKTLSIAHETRKSWKTSQGFKLNITDTIQHPFTIIIGCCKYIACFYNTCIYYYKAKNDMPPLGIHHHNTESILCTSIVVQVIPQFEGYILKMDNSLSMQTYPMEIAFLKPIDIVDVLHCTSLYMATYVMLWFYPLAFIWHTVS